MERKIAGFLYRDQSGKCLSFILALIKTLDKINYTFYACYAFYVWQ